MVVMVMAMPIPTNIQGYYSFSKFNNHMNLSCVVLKKQKFFFHKKINNKSIVIESKEFLFFRNTAEFNSIHFYSTEFSVIY